MSESYVSEIEIRGHFVTARHEPDEWIHDLTPVRRFPRNQYRLGDFISDKVWELREGDKVPDDHEYIFRVRVEAIPVKAGDSA